MFEVVKVVYKSVDVVILVVVVVDYRLGIVVEYKIKKYSDIYVIELVKMLDIVVELGKVKKNS